MTDLLPSWRPSPRRDAIVELLARVDDVPVEERVAYLDNDGTLWTEKPSYVQLDFFVDALARAAATDPTLHDRPELAAVLAGDMAKVAELGLAQVAGALAALFDGQTPERFGAAVDDFLARYRHPTLDAPIDGIVYQPMLELIDALRAHRFTIGIVTGGGTEFVRKVSTRLYGVEPGMVVGTLIGYRFDRDHDGRPTVVRTAERTSTANEGGAKLEHIQAQIGRAPLVAAGNSAGDREMLEWAQAHPRVGLALLVDHDDDEREVAYTSKAATLAEDEAIADVGRRLGWEIVSMRDDWSTVFARSST